LSNKSDFLKKTSSALILIQKSIGILMLLILLFLVFIQVILRAMNLPLMGIEELLILPTIWVYMIGSANASEERNHISVDILEVFLSNKTILTIFSVIRTFVSLTIGIVLTYWLFGFFNRSLML